MRVTPERTGNADPAIAGATDQSAAWDKVNRRKRREKVPWGTLLLFAGKDFVP
jgi:hypothetical protein